MWRRCAAGTASAWHRTSRWPTDCSPDVCRGGPVAPDSRLSTRPQVLDDERAFAHLDALQAFSARRDLTLLQVALGGLAGKPSVSSVIAGASKPEQVRANAAASDWLPSPEDVDAGHDRAPDDYIPLGSRTGHLR